MSAQGGKADPPPTAGQKQPRSLSTGEGSAQAPISIDVDVFDEDPSPSRPEAAQTEQDWHVPSVLNPTERLLLGQDVNRRSLQLLDMLSDVPLVADNVVGPENATVVEETALRALCKTGAPNNLAASRLGVGDALCSFAFGALSGLCQVGPESFDVIPCDVVQVDGLGEVACASLFFWDWCLTFSDEVELIWRRPWKASAYLFLSLRYTTFALMFFNTGMLNFTCESEAHRNANHRRNARTWIRTILMISIIAIVEVILQLRVYVMYMRSRKILVTNLVVFLGVIAVVGGLFSQFGGRIKYLPYSPECGYCTIYPRGLGYCFIPPLVYEAYLALLMVRKSWQDRRLLPQLDGRDIFYILIRDSLIYFIMVSIALATAIFMFSFAPEKALWADLLVDTFGAVGGTRLIFSMLGAVHTPPSRATSEAVSGSVAISIAFPSHPRGTVRGLRGMANAV
ncbi:hypothetical protein EXIGLDRAFT_777178 [Exidia glandulosa HHB12029]|uniref:DUF6533 domain-containing protein n=1 Tax=Exidia glandulosa HHB12029 TaxID=1314781 RepID=A0A165D5N6_EXIGL|nr:hypothetical protein EXIGLDRAFT_777178 [Exidia glandulosa HHB12029]